MLPGLLTPHEYTLEQHLPVAAKNASPLNKTTIVSATVQYIGPTLTPLGVIVASPFRMKAAIARPELTEPFTAGSAVGALAGAATA
jgi:hypothetical protein